ncbi:hypothetical protein [Flavobacterium sp.]|uniref:hypothetical protein n=1 Tax=Flavobacterium sp. TaxID=239 RepID=UPI003752E9D7
MTATLEKPITAFQIKRIMQNCSYQVETKNEWVQWVTGDVNCTSLKSITHDQAIKIMHAQTGTKPLNEPTENWAVFDKANPKHKVILSLLYQMQWVKPSEKWGEVPDLDRLSAFLQSEKSPVKKKLKDMEPLELEKLIKALSGIVKHRYK